MKNCSINIPANTVEILTLKEAAALLRVSEVWLQRAAKRGEIPSFKIGRRICFNSQKLYQWLQQRQ